MKHGTILTVVILGLTALAPGAQAAGCLSGAAAGAVVGHVAGHHAVLGAVGGCVAGHEVNKHQKAQQQQLVAPKPQ